MYVSFLSLDNEKNKISFQAEAIQDENVIQFEDKSCMDTQIRITILKDSFILERFGFIEMQLHFCLDKPTKSVYRNKDGIEFDFEIHTKSLTIKKNKLKVNYDMIMEEDVLSSHTFQVVLFQN